MKLNIYTITRYSATCMAAALAFAACKKDDRSSLYSGGGAPQPLKRASVENLPGSAKITYTLPGDNNVLYIKAEYEIRPGVKREVKASYYDNSLLADGFGDTLEHAVKLTVVNQGDEPSSPLIVTVKPLTPPVIATFRTLKVLNDFGGVNISFANVAKADLAIVSLRDSGGVYRVENSHYSQLAAESYSLRGFDSTVYKLGFFVRDRFGNVSDTLKGDYKPLYEKFLDKSLFRQVDLPTDVKDDWGLPMPNLWDGIVKGGVIGGFFHTQSKPFPMWFTFSLGVKVQLSRMTVWHRQDPPQDWAYAQNNPKKFEIWGCGDAQPAADGSWSNWVLLATHEVIKPSGLPLGQVSQDDITAAARGEEISIPLDKPAVKYIRIKILETYTNSASNIAEVSFWGQP